MAHPKLQAHIDSLKARLKGLHAKIGGGIKGSVMAAGTGAVGFYALDMAVEKVEFLKKDYVLPAILVIGGHLVKKKQYDVGTAIIAIGAFLAAQTFKTNSEKTPSSSGTATTPTGTVSSSSTVPVAGLDGGNAGWMITERAGDSGAMQGGASTSQEPRSDRSLGMGVGELVNPGGAREAMALID